MLCLVMLDGSYRIDTVLMCFVKLQEEACIRQVDQLCLLQHYRNRQYSRKIFKVAKFCRGASRPFRRNFCAYYFVEQARNARTTSPVVDCHAPHAGNFRASVMISCIVEGLFCSTAAI